MSEIIEHESVGQSLKVGRTQIPLHTHIRDLFAEAITGDIIRQDDIASIEIISVMDDAVALKTDVFPRPDGDAGRFYSRAVSRHGPVSIKYDPETQTVKVNSYKQVPFTTILVEIKAWP